MLLFREKVPADWLPKVLSDLPAVLVDHAHMETQLQPTPLPGNSKPTLATLGNAWYYWPHGKAKRLRENPGGPRDVPGSIHGPGLAQSLALREHFAGLESPHDRARRTVRH